MSLATIVPITPSVLRWAISESGYELGELASAARLSTETLDQWCRGKVKPKLGEFRALAEKLKRPVASFLLPRPPKLPGPSVQFRASPGSDRHELNPAERLRLREAVRLQRTLSWIRQELHTEEVALPKSPPSANPEEIAVQTRERLNVLPHNFEQWRSTHAALAAWRAALERSGVFVLMMPLGMDACRGFSLWDDYAPIAVVNTWWNIEARIFTLFHEYGHLVTRTSSACVETESVSRHARRDSTEKWCEEFSAAVLLPRDDLLSYLTHEGFGPRRPLDSVEAVSAIARRYRVSLRATTLRLAQLGFSSKNLYGSLPPLSDHPRDGGGGAGRTRGEIKRDQYGSTAIDLFATALRRDVVSGGDVLDYLDIAPNALAYQSPSDRLPIEHD